ncbi:MAG: tRNA (guanine(10)-N(2))-dimethyltransferase [Candidatus Aenigmatarchaeota archaeon]
MKLRRIKEGKIDILVPEGRIYDASVFYNSEGMMNRDISVSALQVFQNNFDKKVKACDALAASGARGLRYAKEVSGIKSVTINDRNPMAIKLIKRNIKENKLTRKCKATRDDASMLLRKNIFMYIDLDPFGSPSVFMDSAARSIYHKGFLGVTATDQSALAGTYPDSCFRKYGIKTVKTEFYNELGVRILASFIILNMAKYDKAFFPVLSFADQHYYRVFGRIEHAGKIAELLKEFKYVSYCSCGNREIGNKEKCFCGKGFKLIGPIYTGKISETKFCNDVLSDIKKRDFVQKKDEEKLLCILSEEAEMPAFYFELHNMAKMSKNNPPRMDKLIDSLRSKGFKVSRTHFSPTAIKTDASYEEILSCFESHQSL